MRGCEKRMVFLRHADSELFEEAYFVMRRDIARRPAHRDMVAEAERILKGEDRAMVLSRSLPFGRAGYSFAVSCDDLTPSPENSKKEAPLGQGAYDRY